ncbi:MAG: hypothetical protein HDQ92_08810 [Desulfovibrio sp.]|nr:hypothetical protein [Desulfovibrio sp.]
MFIVPDLPVLDSPAKCAALWPKYPEKVVGMWATGFPHQNADVLWRLRQELLSREVPVVFFFRKSALPMLEKVIATDGSIGCNQHIYQLDDHKYFLFLNFIDVLVSNDYCLDWRQARYTDAKLVSLPHHAKLANPDIGNFYYDYVVSDSGRMSDFDYSPFPDNNKIHKNSYFTQLIAGHPKIDLIMEERLKGKSHLSQPLLLIYPCDIDKHINLQLINSSLYEKIWSEIIGDFLKWCPSGIVILSPPHYNRSHPVIEHIKSLFSEDGRLFIDDQIDNKFWLSRATYFITDYSKGFINFCMTAKKPAIRMVYTEDAIPARRDEWGWTISRPNQFIPCLEKMDAEETYWTALLERKQKSEMPTLGKNFVLLADMVKRIFNNDDDSAWPKKEKGHTRCETSGDMLKLVSKVTKDPSYSLGHLYRYQNIVLDSPTRSINPKVWLLVLRRALLAECNRDSFEDIYQLKSHDDTPASISKFIDLWMEQTLASLPLKQFIGLLRYLINKYPQKIMNTLLMTICSPMVSGPHKKRVLFFLLMEMPHFDQQSLLKVNAFAETMPQHFSRPVLDKLNRLLPLAMKVPISLRRFAACILGLKKPLAKRYWQAHRALS